MEQKFIKHNQYKPSNLVKDYCFQQLREKQKKFKIKKYIMTVIETIVVIIMLLGFVYVVSGNVKLFSQASGVIPLNQSLSTTFNNNPWRLT